MATSATTTETGSAELVKGLRLFDATTLVMGSMIGSGIFIVSADVARQVGTPGLLLAAWAISGLMTVAVIVMFFIVVMVRPDRRSGDFIADKERLRRNRFCLSRYKEHRRCENERQRVARAGRKGRG